MGQTWQAFSQIAFLETSRIPISTSGLESLLKAMHKGTRHVGKVPAAMYASRAASERMKDLQEQLDAAVAEENYERAAEVRDAIREVTEKEDGGEEGVENSEGGGGEDEMASKESE